MEKIIAETELIALDYLSAFGFSQEQMIPLIEQGKKDLRDEMLKLRDILSQTQVSFDEVNSSLHVLKGILFQIGNHALAEKLVEVRSHLSTDKELQEIAELLSL